MEEDMTMERRNVLVGLGLAALVTPVAVRSAKAAKDEAKDEVEYLFVQSAQGASLADGVLKLSGINLSTLYFSDRPERIVGHVTTEDFVAHWADGNDSFKSNPPNATLSVLNEKQAQLVVVVLEKPRLEAGSLLYDVDVLDGDETVEGGACSLFIDVIGRPFTPLSYAGMGRRVVRRTSRRTARRVFRRRR
jgi:hypothetical protein